VRSILIVAGVALPRFGEAFLLRPRAPRNKRSPGRDGGEAGRMVS
jgi:hypothetical protein